MFERKDRDVKAILLGAGRGSRLSPLTDDRPKCMVEVGGAPLLDWQLYALRAAGVTDVTVVRGWCRTGISRDGLRTIDNPRFASTNMVQSLRCALDHLRGDVLVAYTDLLYRPEIVQRARECRADVGVVVDLEWRALWQRRMPDPLADAETLRTDGNGRLCEIGQRPESYEQIEAQYLGLVRLSPAGCEILRARLERAAEADARGEKAFGSARTLDEAYLTDLLQGLIDDGVVVKTIPVRGGWTEIDDHGDLTVAEAIVREQNWTHPFAEGRRAQVTG